MILHIDNDQPDVPKWQLHDWKELLGSKMLPLRAWSFDSVLGITFLSCCPVVDFQQPYLESCLHSGLPLFSPSQVNGFDSIIEIQSHVHILGSVILLNCSTSEIPISSSISPLLITSNSSSSLTPSLLPCLVFFLDILIPLTLQLPEFATLCLN